MLRRLRKLWPLAVMMLVLAGCSTTNKDGTPRAIDPNNGFWDRWVVGPLSDFLDMIAGWFNGSYGLAVLVITIIVRMIVLPLTLKQVKSSKAMQALQPELQKIREKYKDDPKLQQEETMKLFSANNVNPMAGCFPIFIQMPVLIGLYHAIMRNPHISSDSFLWLELGKVDPWILPIIAALTTFLQQKFMTKMTGNQMGQMQMLMYIFPVMIFFMSKNFPSALPLYWIYSNTFTIVQNYFIYRPTKEAAAAAAAAAEPVKKSAKASGKASGKSGKKPAKRPSK